MNYPNWGEIQQNQNPNPNPEFSVLHGPNHSLPCSQNQAPNPYQQSNPVSDPYQQSNAASHTGYFLPPQPQPPGVDPPYVPPPPAPVTYAPPVIYAPQPSYEAQQGADAAAAAAAAVYYPDQNARWIAAIQQYGAAPYAAGVSTPNPAIQPQRKQISKKAPKKTTTVVQSAWCEVCKVDCNSKGVLDQHKLGRKHLKNLKKLGAAAQTIYTPVIAAPISAITSTAGPLRATITTSASVPVPAPAPAPVSSHVLPSTSTGEPIIGPQENPAITKPTKSRKKAVARTEDLETKRRKVLEGGAEATAVRACNICNVICNSDTVFNYHIAGQKHASMAKKHGLGAGVGASAT